MVLLSWLHCRPFPGKRPTIWEHSKETFSLESVFADVRNCELQACDVRGKGTVLQRFFWNFQTFSTTFSFEHFQKIVCSDVFSSIVRCRLYLCICIWREQHKGAAWVSLDNFIFFWCSCFETPSWNNLWQNLIEVWTVDYSLVLLLKSDSTRDNFLKF